MYSIVFFPRRMSRQCYSKKHTMQIYPTIMTHFGRATMSAPNLKRELRELGFWHMHQLPERPEMLSTSLRHCSFQICFFWALGFSKLPWPVSNMASFLSPTKWSDVIRCDQLDRNYHNYHPTSNSRAAASRISKVDLPCSSGFAANRWRCGDTGSVCTSATARRGGQRGQRGQRNVGTLCWASCHPNGPWKAHTVETHVTEGQGDAWRSQAGCWIISDFVK